eukprot:3771696-Rhodomonas_salina.1
MSISIRPPPSALSVSIHPSSVLSISIDPLSAHVYFNPSSLGPICFHPSSSGPTSRLRCTWSWRGKHAAVTRRLETGTSEDGWKQTGPSEERRKADRGYLVCVSSPGAGAESMVRVRELKVKHEIGPSEDGWKQTGPREESRLAHGLSSRRFRTSLFCTSPGARAESMVR